MVCLRFGSFTLKSEPLRFWFGQKTVGVGTGCFSARTKSDQRFWAKLILPSGEFSSRGKAFATLLIFRKKVQSPISFCVAKCCR
jgi:hypothetical protein